MHDLSKYLAFLIFGVLLLFSISVSGQSRSLSDQFPFNRWSLEAQVGGGFPLRNGSRVNESGDTASFYNRSLPSYSVGVRYMFTPTFGIRPSYHYHDFNKSGQDLSIHSYALEGIYSFSNYFPEGRISHPRKWNVLAHLGGSYSVGHYKSAGRDNIITGMIGSTLQWRPFRHLAFTFDLTAHFNSFLDNSFAPNDNDPKQEGGKWERLFTPEVFIAPSIGVQFYFGKQYQHIDWR